jgi:hypothetical protein
MANSRLCSIPDCSKPMKAKDFCCDHYRRFRLYGDPLAGRAGHGEPQRFYREVVLPYDGGDCLIWPFSTHRNGYAQMRVDGHLVTVSRMLCEATNGPPPTSKHHAAHSCGNGRSGCVTKRHLLWKTKAENEADKLVHGTHNRGERHPMSKLTEAQAREILSLKGAELQRVIADRYGISNQAVSNIQIGKTWSWLTA